MAHVCAGSNPVDYPKYYMETMLEFKSSDSAEPSEPAAPVPYSPRMRGTIAPTVVEPGDIIKRMIAQKAEQQTQDAEGIPLSPGLEKELNSLGVPDEMQKFLQIALRKPHFITITYLSNSGRFQHHVNMHSQFPAQEAPKVLEHLRVKAEEKWLGKPDVAGIFKHEVAKHKRLPPSSRGSKRRRGKGKRR